VLDDIEELLGIDCNLNSRNEFILFGHLMCCFGSDKSDSYKSMRGLTAYGHYGNEVSLSHKNTIDQAIKRCSGKGARFFWDTNPDAPTHYIKKEYIDQAGKLKDSQGRPIIYAESFTIDDNTKLDPDYVYNLKQTTPTGLRYDRDILGKWVAAEGVVYADFIPAQMVVDNDNIPEIKRVWAGVDWGYEHLGVILIIGEDTDGAIYILDEVSSQHRDIDWWVKQRDRMKDRWFLDDRDFICDSARPEYVRKFNGVNAKKEVIEGITFVASYMKQNRFFVADNCTGTINGLSAYIWKDTGTKEEPEKVNDDEMDAMRYAIYTKLARNLVKIPKRPAGLR
jgi:PBSX family phage terminase large subunit